MSDKSLCKKKTWCNENESKRDKSDLHIVQSLKTVQDAWAWAIHVLSGCQCPVMHNLRMLNMVIERHNIACMMILKLVSEGSYGANLVQLDASNTNCLAHHDLQVPEQISNRA
eukprot:716719-Pelagomonas_calceolata.AAC.1